MLTGTPLTADRPYIAGSLQHSVMSLPLTLQLIMLSCDFFKLTYQGKHTFIWNIALPCLRQTAAEGAMRPAIGFHCNCLKLQETRQDMLHTVPSGTLGVRSAQLPTKSYHKLSLHPD